MVLDMDSELQRLIYVSVEKMTTHPGTNGRSLPAHGSRKSRGIDLRKALLVAHVLQDMRTAYVSDDYKMLLNTVCPDGKTDNGRTRLITEYQTTEYLSSKRRKFLTDAWSTGRVERPPRSDGAQTVFMTSEYRSPSADQSCVTCTDATMSRISQITHPIPVSVNTSYVLCHQSSGNPADDSMEEEEDETPAVCEQVEVTSSNDDELTDTETVRQRVHGDQALSVVTNTTELSTNTVIEQSVTKQCTTQGRCPLPRKKRPLPKEFLDLDADSTVESKKSRSEQDVRSHDDVAVTSSSDVIVRSLSSRGLVAMSSPSSETIVTSSSSSDALVTSSTYLLNTTTATTLTQSTALSNSDCFGAKNSQNSPCTLVTSSVYSGLLSTTACDSIASSSSAIQVGPKVVVEKNKLPSFHSLWSWTLPVTCTQPRLSKLWLMEGVCKSQLTDISNLRNSSIQSAHLTGLVAY